MVHTGWRGVLVSLRGPAQLNIVISYNHRNPLRNSVILGLSLPKPYMHLNLMMSQKTSQASSAYTCMVLVGYNQDWQHSFRDFGDCGELQYLTMLVPLRVRLLGARWFHFYNKCIIFCHAFKQYYPRIHDGCFQKQGKSR